jgi:hypothetical protein
MIVVVRSVKDEASRASNSAAVDVTVGEGLGVGVPVSAALDGANPADVPGIKADQDTYCGQKWVGRTILAE